MMEGVTVICAYNIENVVTFTGIGGVENQQSSLMGQKSIRCIVTEVPGTTDRATRNGVWDGFLHCVNENVSRSRPQNGVPRMWNAPSFHVHGDYDQIIETILHGT